METIKIRTDGKLLRSIKQIVFVVSISLTIFPQLFYWYGINSIPVFRDLSILLSALGLVTLVPFTIHTYLFSRFSPILYLKIRKKIIIFTRKFTKNIDDGTMVHSVSWKCRISDSKIVITLISRGLILNDSKTAKEFTEYVALNLLKFEDKEGEFIFTYGQTPLRYDGLEVIQNVQL